MPAFPPSPMESAREKHVALGQLIRTVDAHMPPDDADRERLHGLAERTNALTVPDEDGPEAAVLHGILDPMLEEVRALARKVLSDADAFLLTMCGDADDETRKRVRTMLDDPASGWNRSIERHKGAEENGDYPDGAEW